MSLFEEDVENILELLDQREDAVHRVGEVLADHLDRIASELPGVAPEGACSCARIVSVRCSDPALLAHVLAPGRRLQEAAGPDHLEDIWELAEAALARRCGVRRAEILQALTTRGPGSLGGLTASWHESLTHHPEGVEIRLQSLWLTPLDEAGHPLTGARLDRYLAGRSHGGSYRAGLRWRL